MKKRLLAGLLATSIALSISMGAFPAMAATNDDFVEDWEDAADFTADSYSSGYSSSEQLFDDIIFFDLDEEVDDTAAEVIAEEDTNDSSDTEMDRAADSIEETEPEDEVQDTDAAEDRNDWEDSDKETKSGTQRLPQERQYHPLGEPAGGRPAPCGRQAHLHHPQERARHDQPDHSADHRGRSEH